MVWRAFCINIMPDLTFPSTKINFTEYIKLLESKLMPFLKRQIFQQDNASAHVRQSVSQSNGYHQKISKYLNGPHVPQIKIENIWGILARKIYADNRQYESIFHLKEAVIDAWKSLTEEMTKKSC